MKIWSGEIEWTEPRVPAGPLTTREGESFDAGRFLVRVAGTPVGFVQVSSEDGVISVEQVLALAKVELAEPIERELAAASKVLDREAGPVAPDATRPYWMAASNPVVTVALCTHNRPDGARRCVESLQRLRYANAEILVIDNAPSDGATESVVRELASADPRIRYVREPRAGLSHARNRALAEAGGTFIAFTDDDVRVDPLWVDGLLRGFARTTEVSCVTGLVASASLEHPAEQYFDSRVWWASNCQQRLYTPERQPGDSVLHPYAAGTFGTGANFAFRLADVRNLGGFDECLGAGSPTRGGEDLDIFVRLLLNGRSISYEPSALVWHDHRVDEDLLRSQMYAYGMGLSAFVVKYLASPATRGAVIRRLFVGARYALMLARRSRAAEQGSSREAPGRGLFISEFRGALAGPIFYFQARTRQDREHLKAVSP